MIDKMRRNGITDKIKKRFKDSLVLFLALLMCLSGMAAVGAGISGCSFGLVDEGLSVYADVNDSIVGDIAGKVLRFHVIGNSSGDEDQRVKLAVKSAVTDLLEPVLTDAPDAAKAKEIIEENMEQILKTAGEVLSREGAEYSCTAELTTCYFPLKIYGDIALPPGEYEALRIVLGEGMGKNWWCIMFPPLCFVDAACGVVPDDSKDTLKGLLTGEEYGMIEQKNIEVKPKLKIVEFLKDLFS